MEEIFNSYKEANKFIQEYGYTDYKDLCLSIFPNEKEEFEKAIKTSEEETLKFLKNN